MNFKKTPVYALLAALAILSSSCAQTATSDANLAEELYLSSWIKANYGDLQPESEYGYYILSSQAGSGETVGDTEDAPYVTVEYSGWTLDGSLGVSSTESAAKQLGTYSPKNFYGPVVWGRATNSAYSITKGLSDLIGSMKVGQRTVAAIPGWLLSNYQYDSYKDYRENVTGTSSAVYDITVREVITDITQWQKDSLVSFMTNHGIVAEEDTTMTGFYYQRLVEPTDTTTFDAEEEVYLNYVLRRLDGTVVDTNIKDTAKVHHIYNESSTYEPVYVTWSSDSYSDLTMGSSASSMIEGFKYGVYKMRKGEVGRLFFVSAYGYKESGSGDAIPGYSPLRFDIELIGPEEE